MKKILFQCIILQLFVLNIYGQEKEIDYYKVKEIINSSFGGSITTYSVSDLSLVKKVDLGLGNQRIITPVYKKYRVIPARNYASKVRRTIPPVSSTNSDLSDNLETNQSTRNRIASDNQLKQRDNNNFENENNTNIKTYYKTVIKPNDTNIASSYLKDIEPTESIKNHISDKQKNKNLANLAAIRETNLDEETSNDSYSNIKYTLLNKNNVPIEDSKLDEELLEKEVQNFKKHAVYEVPKNQSSNEKIQFVYVRIFDTYERVAEKGYVSIILFKKLSDYFYFKDQLVKATKWYKKLFDLTNNLDSSFYYRYANCLIKTGKDTKEGNRIMNKFNLLNKTEL